MFKFAYSIHQKAPQAWPTFASRDGCWRALVHAATVEEMRRRGATSSVETDLPVRPEMAKMPSPPTEKRRHVNIADVPLTRGQVNAVRAAFKAGITPSRIARQFGISESNVRKAPASDESNR
jgi:hypothetical protein